LFKAVRHDFAVQYLRILGQIDFIGVWREFHPETIRKKEYGAVEWWAKSRERARANISLDIIDNS
jgi:hypothetical protein